jgi:Cu2+-exporting ATPase
MLQNLDWAARYNVIAIPLAAGALAWAGLTLSPAIGAILMSMFTIVVALKWPGAELSRTRPSACVRWWTAPERPTAG